MERREDLFMDSDQCDPIPSSFPKTKIELMCISTYETLHTSEKLCCVFLDRVHNNGRCVFFVTALHEAR